MDFLAILRAKLTAFGELLTADVDLSTPVPHCGDWTFYDLVDHVCRGNEWVVTAVAEQRGDEQGTPAPRDPVELRPWFDATATALVTALSVDPATEAWTFTRSAPRTVGFWRRRRAHETAMHLWDAQDALGKGEPFESELAADGIAEVFDMFAPRMIDRKLAPAPETAIQVRANDIGRIWVYGPGEPIAEIAAPVSDLLLLLWQRKASTDPEFSWQGDRVSGERVLEGPLTP
ncbi:maleylpyruvate isomerase family mycothiol-dependent enzyme [Nocardia sp. NPDC050406]|uniref:maleylpyruvate isomerase family mycothiol-dependent enzyme n=1 Tax=Nocardia sp. NPDC050406 TaxID=3364318 RepID=UPI0037AF7836